MQDSFDVATGRVPVVDVNTILSEIVSSIGTTDGAAITDEVEDFVRSLVITTCDRYSGIRPMLAVAEHCNAFLYHRAKDRRTSSVHAFATSRILAAIRKKYEYGITEVLVGSAHPELRVLVVSFASTVCNELRMTGGGLPALTHDGLRVVARMLKCIVGPHGEAHINSVKSLGVSGTRLSPRVQMEQADIDLLLDLWLHVAVATNIDSYLAVHGQLEAAFLNLHPAVRTTLWPFLIALDERVASVSEELEVCGSLAKELVPSWVSLAKVVCEVVGCHVNVNPANAEEAPPPEEDRKVVEARARKTLGFIAKCESELSSKLKGCDTPVKRNQVRNEVRLRLLSCGEDTAAFVMAMSSFFSSSSLASTDPSTLSPFGPACFADKPILKLEDVPIAEDALANSISQEGSAAGSPLADASDETTWGQLLRGERPVDQDHPLFRKTFKVSDLNELFDERMKAFAAAPDAESKNRAKSEYAVIVCELFVFDDSFVRESVSLWIKAFKWTKPPPGTTVHINVSGKSMRGMDPPPTPDQSECGLQGHPGIQGEQGGPGGHIIFECPTAMALEKCPHVIFAANGGHGGTGGNGGKGGDGSSGTNGVPGVLHPEPWSSLYSVMIIGVGQPAPVLAGRAGDGGLRGPGGVGGVRGSIRFLDRLSAPLSRTLADGKSGVLGQPGDAGDVSDGGLPGLTKQLKEQCHWLWDNSKSERPGYYTGSLQDFLDKLKSSGFSKNKSGNWVKYPGFFSSVSDSDFVELQSEDDFRKAYTAAKSGAKHEESTPSTQRQKSMQPFDQTRVNNAVNHHLKTMSGAELIGQFLAPGFSTVHSLTTQVTEKIVSESRQERLTHEQERDESPTSAVVFKKAGPMLSSSAVVEHERNLIDVLRPMLLDPSESLTRDAVLSVVKKHASSHVLCSHISSALHFLLDGAAPSSYATRIAPSASMEIANIPFLPHHGYEDFAALLSGDTALVSITAGQDLVWDTESELVAVATRLLHQHGVEVLEKLVINFTEIQVRPQVGRILATFVTLAQPLTAVPGIISVLHEAMKHIDAIPIQGSKKWPRAKEIDVFRGLFPGCNVVAEMRVYKPTTPKVGDVARGLVNGKGVELLLSMFASGVAVLHPLDAITIYLFVEMLDHVVAMAGIGYFEKMQRIHKLGVDAFVTSLRHESCRRIAATPIYRIPSQPVLTAVPSMAKVNESFLAGYDMRTAGDNVGTPILAHLVQGDEIRNTTVHQEYAPGGSTDALKQRLLTRFKPSGSDTAGWVLCDGKGNKILQELPVYPACGQVFLVKGRFLTKLEGQGAKSMLLKSRDRKSDLSPLLHPERVTSYAALMTRSSQVLNVVVRHRLLHPPLLGGAIDQNLLVGSAVSVISGLWDDALTAAEADKTLSALLRLDTAQLECFLGGVGEATNTKLAASHIPIIIEGLGETPVWDSLQQRLLETPLLGWPELIVDRKLELMVDPTKNAGCAEYVAALKILIRSFGLGTLSDVWHVFEEGIRNEALRNCFVQAAKSFIPIDAVQELVVMPPPGQERLTELQAKWKTLRGEHRDDKEDTANVRARRDEELLKAQPKHVQGIVRRAVEVCKYHIERRTGNNSISTILHEAFANQRRTPSAGDKHGTHGLLRKAMRGEISSWRDDKVTFGDLFGCIAYAYYLGTGLEPYVFQLLDVVILLEKPGGSLARVYTGEGKTLLLAMIAAVRALVGFRIDIVSSSNKLACDGFEITKKFFDIVLFDDAKSSTSATRVVDGVIQPANEHAYLASVVYTTVSNLASHELMHRNGEGIGGWAQRMEEDRYLLVDEVDLVLLDRSSEIVYRSHRVGELQLMLPLFAAIWRQVVTHKGDSSATQAIADLLTLEVGDGMHGVPHNQREHCCAVMRRYVHSAMVAYRLELNVHFVISNEGGTSPRVVPYDVATGEERLSTSWSFGLTQFLELKYALQPTSEAPHAQWVSTWALFGWYGKNLTGVSGTLGFGDTQELLKAFFDIKTIVMLPKSLPSEVVIQPEQVLANKEAWLDAIVKGVQHEVLKNKRLVLVIGETVEAVAQIRTRLSAPFTEAPGGHRGSPEITVYSRYADEIGSAVEKPGVILASNKGGRGLDLIPGDSLPSAGVHVLMTYAAPLRLIEQAFGRTGRNGKRGSVSLVLHDPRPDILALELIAEAEVAQGHELRKQLVDLQSRVRVEDTICDLAEKKWKSLQPPADAPQAVKRVMDQWRALLQGRFALWLSKMAPDFEAGGVGDCLTNSAWRELDGYEAYDPTTWQSSLPVSGSVECAIMGTKFLECNQFALAQKCFIKDSDDYVGTSSIALAFLHLDKRNKNRDIPKAIAYGQRARAVIEDRVEMLKTAVQLCSRSSGEGLTAFEDHLRGAINVHQFHLAALNTAIGRPLVAQELAACLAGSVGTTLADKIAECLVSHYAFAPTNGNIMLVDRERIHGACRAAGVSPSWQADRIHDALKTMARWDPDKLQNLAVVTDAVVWEKLISCNVLVHTKTCRLVTNCGKHDPARVRALCLRTSRSEDSLPWTVGSGHLSLKDDMLVDELCRHPDNQQKTAVATISSLAALSSVKISGLSDEQNKSVQEMVMQSLLSLLAKGAQQADRHVILSDFPSCRAVAALKVELERLSVLQPKIPTKKLGYAEAMAEKLIVRPSCKEDVSEVVIKECSELVALHVARCTGVCVSEPEASAEFVTLWEAHRRLSQGGSIEKLPSLEAAHVHEAMIRGADHVLVLSLGPKIFEPMLVAMFGLAQFAVGSMMMAFCPLFAAAAEHLISGGLNDMMFGLMSLVTGTFSWSSYVANKALFHALYAARVGLGKLVRMMLRRVDVGFLEKMRAGNSVVRWAGNRIQGLVDWACVDAAPRAVTIGSVFQTAALNPVVLQNAGRALESLSYDQVHGLIDAWLRPKLREAVAPAVKTMLSKVDSIEYERVHDYIVRDIALQRPADGKRGGSTAPVAEGKLGKLLSFTSALQEPMQFVSYAIAQGGVRTKLVEQLFASAGNAYSRHDEFTALLATVKGRIERFARNLLDTQREAGADVCETKLAESIEVIVGQVMTRVHEELGGYAKLISDSGGLRKKERQSSRAASSVKPLGGEAALRAASVGCLTKNRDLVRKLTTPFIKVDVALIATSSHTPLGNGIRLHLKYCTLDRKDLSDPNRCKDDRLCLFMLHVHDPVNALRYLSTKEVGESVWMEVTKQARHLCDDHCINRAAVLIACTPESRSITDEVMAINDTRNSDCQFTRIQFPPEQLAQQSITSKYSLHLAADWIRKQCEKWAVNALPPALVIATTTYGVPLVMLAGFRYIAAQASDTDFLVFVKDCFMHLNPIPGEPTALVEFTFTFMQRAKASPADVMHVFDAIALHSTDRSGGSAFEMCETGMLKWVSKTQSRT